MDYYSPQEKTTFLNQPCNLAMGGYKYISDKMVRKPGTPPCRESADNFEYPSLFSSKTYSILSYIVGGFVGSKSQMNNNKHNLSYDLSAAIFNILNPCKYDRDKMPTRKNTENSFYCTASKINPECYEKYIRGKSSHRSEKNCLIDMMDLDWLSTLPLQDFIEQENYVSALNNFTIIKNSKTENQSQKNTNFFKNDYIQESANNTYNIPKEPVKNLEESETNIKSSVKNEEKFAEGDPEKLNQLHDISSNICIAQQTDSTAVTDSNCQRRSTLYSLTERLRQQSECSVESTDSESFIVFDDVPHEENDRRNGNEFVNSIYYDIYDEDDDEEEEEDEDDVDDCGSDIYLGDKELVEANKKWAKNYSNVSVQSDETDKKVQFNEVVKVNKIVAWDYAYRAARPGPWEQMARDRVRFNERILRMSPIISPVLKKEHRDKIYKKIHS